ncbi:MAG: START-like domain-containing protein [Paludibacteraceae bacterium]|nr:START-like domain-containing protein [Paludibacteraceae bacterium]
MKEKFQLEFNLSNVSINVLWTSISTPVGLSEWFADKVAVDGENKNEFTFYWGKSFQKAILVNNRLDSYVKFRWDEDRQDPVKPYFELRISIMELTNEVVLTVTDFAEPEDKDDSIKLWSNQIEDLKTAIGL